MYIIFLNRYALRIHGDLHYVTTVTEFLDGMLYREEAVCVQHPV
jgi:hypothetical protein